MSPANTYDPVKVQAQRAAQRNRPENRRRDRGQLAGQLVREWSPAQRSRIRAILLQLRWFGQADRGEMEVIKLIDQINEEEQR